ncbi:MAG: hypothetical protein QG553_147 [Patescibacteria group bacterium]|nr:hypothetical protein [Patescibacteria group bacterium]
MFGHDDNDEKKDETVVVAPTTDPTTSDTPDVSSVGAVTDPSPATDSPSTPPSDNPLVSSPADDNSDQAEEAATPDVPASEPTEEPSAAPEVTPEVTTTDSSTEEAPASSNTSPNSEDDDELLTLKKQALEELAPLVDQLDQTPEEKFKTTMMMIQATDSASLVKVAHEAAQKISDEKVRAQALLDIVNEINYFTQK